MEISKSDQADLRRAIESKKAALPKHATLELQRRPRPKTPRRLKAFLNIARGRKA